MNREQIIRMAGEAGLVLGYPFDWETLERFAVLVADAEREACAKVCDDRCIEDGWEGCYADACAVAIRARSET